MGATMKTFVSILAATIAMTSIGSAQAQSNARPTAPARSSTTIVTWVTEADLRALVLAEGHTIDAMHPFEAPSVRGKTKEGLVFVLIGTACSVKGAPGCQGVMMQVRYDSDDTVTVEGVNKSNMSQAAVSTWWDKKEKTVGFTRYVVLDDGVTWMNLRQNLRVLLSIQDKAKSDVFPDQK